MERRFVAVNLNNVDLATLFTRNANINIDHFRGLPEGSVFAWAYIDNGQVIAVFYNPSFGIVARGALIPFVEIDFCVIDQAKTTMDRMTIERMKVYIDAD